MGVIAVVGILGVVFGLAYILIAALSHFPPYRHNPGLYLAGAIALIGGIILVIFGFGGLSS